MIIRKCTFPKKLDLTETLDGETTYKDADYIVIVVSTDYDNRNNFLIVQRLKLLSR